MATGTDNLFLRFDPDHRGCEGSNLVKVTRVAPVDGKDTWEVEPDGAAKGCLVPQSRNPPLGLLIMPFKFTVTVL